jgi:cold shock CspA family protein
MEKTKERTMDKKFVVFIDGENISWRIYEDVISTVKNRGEILEKRIYGNWDGSNMIGWRKELDKNPAITIQVPHNGMDAMNATDCHIMMEAAVASALSKEIIAFCIVSSDADYQCLSRHLRAHGKYVLGIGEKKSSNKWRDSCDDFVELKVENNDEDKAPEGTVSKRDEILLETVLEYGFLHTTQKDGWVLVAPFCEIIKKGHPDFFWEDFGGRAQEVLKKYAQETGNIEIDESDRCAVRIRKKTADVLALGIIDQLNDNDDFGFIKCSGFGQKYYFRRRDIEDSDLALKKGCEVIFTICKSPEPRKATSRERNGIAIGVKKRPVNVEEKMELSGKCIHLPFPQIMGQIQPDGPALLVTSREVVETTGIRKASG